MQQLRLQGVTVGSLEDFGNMLDGVALHRMQPVVDKVFPFEQARDVFAYLASGRHFGKVAIAIG
jgi:NADPH:quinone reductase-like Zn-dependent oxidoreductase